MATALDREIRKQLDKAVRKARLVAEDGARKALTELGVEDARKPDRLSREKAELRNRLRAHAQSLGDVKAPNDSIRANRLVREIAYEHWHRALFARFLAENNLLIDPDHKVAVSLSDLEEVAKEEGRDLVELAADWAEPMLPQIFRKDDPVLALALPPETKAGIIEIVKDLSPAVFRADDSLGWVYQFWQADQKDRVNASEVKIGADELPAVTQLFTEDYMVLFLLENTLGAWWAGKVLTADPVLAAGAISEDELRERTSPPGYRWTYLRFVREPRKGETYETATGPWRPATGVFEGWPKAAKEITVLDPCMGSGHFLVFALPILIAFRRVEEGLDERAAVKAVLAENLFGLEVDPRCTQIAAFALALASWKRLGGPEPLPQLNLACSGLAIGLGKAEFLKLAEKIADAEGWTGSTDLLGTDRTPLGTTAASTHRGELEALYKLFEEAPNLGSLIDPRQTLERTFGPLYATGIEKLGAVFDRLLEAGEGLPDARETAVTAHGIAKAARLLSGRYTLIATNVPYLKRGQQNSTMRNYIARHHEAYKGDLGVAFVARLHFLTAGTMAVVSPQGWLFQPSYRDARTDFLQYQQLASLAWLGAGAFETISGEVVKVCLLIASRQLQSGVFALELSDQPFAEKIALLSSSTDHRYLIQSDFDADPEKRILFHQDGGAERLEAFARSYKGITTNDDPAFVLYFWELARLDETWDFLQSTVAVTTDFSGMSQIIRFEGGNGSLRALAAAQTPDRHQDKRGINVWGKAGVAVSCTGSLPCSRYLGVKFDTNAAVLEPIPATDLPAIWAYAASRSFGRDVRKIDKSLKVTNATLVKVPFDLVHWRRVAGEKYLRGLPKPQSNDPTQWLFDGHPRGSADPNVAPDGTTEPRLVTPQGVRPGIAEHPLQVIVSRMLGYRWARQTGSSFMECPAVIEPDEVDRSGLVASDGIVPLPALVGEADAATRLRELIRAVWGADYGESTIRELLAAEEAKAVDLATWLADECFDGHCRLFQQTPFIWHVWDGLRGGFSALVNYHRLCEENGAGRRLLEKLRDSYLGEWIAVQKRALAAGEAGAEERLIAAEHLRGELTKIIEGEPPYDIFVRWKPLYNQPIGWEPDIDDGVRLNIRPFLIAKPKNSGRKDGCILRVTPRVKKHEGADRGAEPHREKEDFPWFWADDGDVETENYAGGPSFKGRRYNDFHYTRAFKQRARDAKADAARGVA